MKKTLIAIFALAGMVNAASIELDNTFYTNPAAWVYIWDNANSQWTNVRSLTDFEPKTGNNPAGNDPYFIGYELKNVAGKQVMSATEDTFEFTMDTWPNQRMYLSSTVTLTGNNNGFNALDVYVDDFGRSENTLFEMGAFWKRGNPVNFAGTLTLSGEDFSRTLFHSTNMQQCAGTWSAADIVVTDANGNTLTYTTDEANYGKAGYYWLSTDTFVSGQAYSVVLNAKALPEPATATLSLLALAGLAARRRRK